MFVCGLLVKWNTGAVPAVKLVSAIQLVVARLVLALHGGNFWPLRKLAFKTTPLVLLKLGGSDKHQRRGGAHSIGAGLIDRLDF